MPKNVTNYSLLISCPGDVQEEVRIIDDCVSQFNALYTDALKITITTKHWRKDSYAQSGGKPQELLNDQFVNDCDAAVAIFWTRFGTPTDKHGSGTEEEVEIMLSSGKQVFMYFSDKPLSPPQINEEGYKKVQAFRNKYKDRGIYFTYSSDEEFKTLFFAHLSQHFLSEKRLEEVKRERHSKLKIVGIDQNQHINDEGSIIQFALNTEMTISKYREIVRALFEKISAQKLGKRIEVPEKIAKYVLSFDKPVEISEDDRKLICYVAEKIGINITEDFFALGNLSQSSISLSVMGSYSLKGTDAEKNKYYDIQELLDKISKLLEWAPIENAFMDQKCLKLALQNCGTDVDEDIEIALKIPKKSLLQMSELPEFNNDEKGYLLNDCDMSELFGISSTSTYSNFDSSIIASRHYSPHVPVPSGFPGHTPDYSDSFESELAEVFCFSCFDEGEEYIVKLKFDYIKHNTTIAFPSIIFIKEPFESLSYTITSKNSPEIVFGEIKIKDDSKDR